MSAIYKKEMKVYLNTLPCYIFLSSFLLIGGLWFSSRNILDKETDFMPVINALSYAILILTPLLTMKLIATEHESKTDRLIITAPIKTRSIVMGKYFAALTVFFIALSITLLFPLLLSALGTPSWPGVFTGYLGLVLFGATLIAAGLFISSLMRKTLVAGFTTLAVMLFILLFDELLPHIVNPSAHMILSKLTPISNELYFMKGFISPAAILYFLSVTFMLLFMTVRMMEHRKWSKGRCL